MHLRHRNLQNKQASIIAWSRAEPWLLRKACGLYGVEREREREREKPQLLTSYLDPSIASPSSFNNLVSSVFFSSKRKKLLPALAQPALTLHVSRVSHGIVIVCLHHTHNNTSRAIAAPRPSPPPPSKACGGKSLSSFMPFTIPLPHSVSSSTTPSRKPS
ncbi:hypothetical protein CGCVW01_v000659 [Colletotrichum viniferum]|nr:hypothetical protein CGCVW01_v000659 [Colletotrichum viniferum]